ncbi:hypothetical protein STIAU_1990 [Stigmatella aurantiaca DW4/3-1]|uniref:Uncharacterized protein n=1 Tax=Stigmatella aurantiaca (strain DW4/3-1) TaxID=378806 RepID=Q09CY3_STIAD|nr:hypothetical protein STIAU_1990 [Stigmatella aurantiaca DW4/3-1]
MTSIEAMVDYPAFASFEVSVSSPFCQLQGHSSSVWNASRVRTTSATLRPTDKSFTDTWRMMPWGSMMKVARSATPSSLWRMPSALVSSCFRSASMGKGRFFRSAWCVRHAWCTNSLSVLRPSTCASRSLKSLFFFPNSAISVGQMKVKSFGHANRMIHFPL